MDKAGKSADNYENVNMEMSDESDNEMFACKDEYKAFKQQFSSKPKEKTAVNEYGGEEEAGAMKKGIEFSGPSKANPGGGGGSEYGGGNEYGGDEYGGGSEYGAGGKQYDQPANPFPSAGGFRHQPKYGFGPGFGYGSRRPAEPRPPSPTPAKIEKEPKLYKDKDNEEKRSKSRDGSRSSEPRSKSKDRSRRSRSRSKGRRRSRSRDKKDKKRSSSRSRSRDKGRDRKNDHHSRDDGRDRRDLKRDGGRDGGNWRRGDGGDWRRGGGGRGGGFRREEQRRNVEEQMRKVEEMGVEMPKYYKAGAINPVSYAEQVQKRKMLWKKPGADDAEEKAAAAAKAEEKAAAATSFNKWEATNFGDDKANEKFRRLMGIKAAPKPEEFNIEDAPGKDTEKIMNDLQKNYEQARQQTHRNRGIGLGFSNSEGVYQPQPPPVYNAAPPGFPPQAKGPASVARGGYGIAFVKKQ